MNIYYFANHPYQFSHVLPIYRQIGGTMIHNKIKKILQTKRYLRDANNFSHPKTFLNAPPLINRDREHLHDLEGVIISLSNFVIGCDHEKCKSIFVGHGTGDKKYGNNARMLESYDYHFISGPKHLEKLIDFNANIPDEKMIKIGNLRFDDYINNKIDRDREMDRLGIKDRKRQNVLYAPTWRYGNGTLQKYFYKFSQEITKEFNLIVRPHYRERRNIPKLRMWAKLKGIKHVYFSNPSTVAKSDTMNDFAVSDIMISDTSSVLYEYLVTRQPIIVALNDYKKLHNMPDEMNVMRYAVLYDGSQDIVKLIEQTLAEQNHREKYDELLNNCFYFNDGKSVQRATQFVKSISN